MRWICLSLVKVSESDRVCLSITVPNGFEGLLRSKPFTLMFES